MVSAFEKAILAALSPAGVRARLLILTYHRILPRRDSLLMDEPDAQAFADQMDVLCTYCNVLALPEAVERLKTGSLPARAACLTFDDGYANNLEVAMPILERRGLTATVFIAVDAIRRGIMWNDLVIEGVRAARDVLKQSAVNSPDQQLDATSDRNAYIAALIDRLKYLPLERRWELAMGFFTENASHDPPRLMLREPQIAELATRGHDVGAHTISHPILRELTPERARAEILDSARWLTDALGSPPMSFAYPNGKPGRDYDQMHVEMVRETGFKLAVSTAWGCATRRSDIFQLPRCAPWELSTRSFPVRLAKRYLAA